MAIRRLPVVFVLLIVVCVSASCSQDMDHRAPLFLPVSSSTDGGTPLAANAIDQVEIVRGVPSRGRDPAVVAIDIGGEGLCSGALIGEDLVLTARHCVTRTEDSIVCPPQSKQVGATRDAAGLRILSGDDAAHGEEIARGEIVVAPLGSTLCDADIAFIVLDRAVVGITPLLLRADPPLTGERIRAVGFGRRSEEDGAGKKLVREHVRILDVASHEFTVGEATCQGDSGGPALDEGSGEIVGVISRGGPTCEGRDVHNLYSRVDVHRALYQEALRKAAEARTTDGGPPKKGAKGGKSKPPSDMGNTCRNGADCATGVCIGTEASAYCSRTCGAGDRCPAGFHCKAFRRGTEPPVSACSRVSG